MDLSKSRASSTTSAISTLNSLATTAVHDNRRFYKLMARRTIWLLAFTLALQAAPPDFSKDVAPILEKHCLQCHRPGGIGVPFTSYETVRPWAKAIKQAVATRYMPPWSADPQKSLKFPQCRKAHRSTDRDAHRLG